LDLANIYIDKETKNTFAIKVSEIAKWYGYFVLESSLKSAVQNNPVDLYRGLSIVRQV